MSETYLIIILIAILGFSLLSKRVENSIITMPIIFTLLGWLIGEGGLEILPANSHKEIVYILAETTLTLLLFSDASRIDLKALMHAKSIPFRLLFIGLPLTVIFGMLFTHWLNPTISWPLSLLVAAILTPTDMILSQLVLTKNTIAKHLRGSLNIESGLNDGLILPFILIATFIATGENSYNNELLIITLKELIFGPLVGSIIGFTFAKLLDFCIHHKLSASIYGGIYFLATAILAYLIANSIGGNGSMAAFIAGLIFGNTIKSNKSFISEFMEAEGQILAMITFLIFGAVMLPDGLKHANIQTLLLSLSFLTFIRLIPVFIALGGTKLNYKERFFIGWFGPRGLASILFALLVSKEFNIAQFNELLACIVLTVLLSIILHGVSTWPLVSIFSKKGEK